MGRRAYYKSISPELARQAESDFRTWSAVVMGDPSVGPFDLRCELGKSYVEIAQMIGSCSDGEWDVLGRAVYGSRPLHTPTPAGRAELGPEIHDYERLLADTFLVPTEDVAAAAARLNVVDRSDLFTFYEPELSSGEDLEKARSWYWDRVEDLRAFYAAAAVRCDAVAVEIG